MRKNNNKEVLEALIKDLIETIENFIDESQDVINIVALLNQKGFIADLSISVGLSLYEPNNSNNQLKFELNNNDREFLAKNHILINID
ncbi:MAG: hypothetical protein ACMUIP_01375 [bacterium]